MPHRQQELVEVEVQFIIIIHHYKQLLELEAEVQVDVVVPQVLQEE
tara:strand:+ start:497 stop:634 length:138 start_codon:yes stop_codon:yes gene_type:complete